MKYKKEDPADDDSVNTNSNADDNVSAFDIDDNDDAFGDIKGRIEEDSAETDVDNLMAGKQDQADDKKEGAKKERNERRKKAGTWSFISVVLVLTIAAVVVGNNTDSANTVDSGNNGGPGGIADPDSQPPSVLEDNTQYEPPPPVVSDNEDQAAIPIEKDDYSRHNNSVISDGLSEWADVYDETRGGAVENAEDDYSIGSFGGSAQETEVDEVEDPAAFRELIETSTTANSIAGYAANFPSRYEGYTNHVQEDRLDNGTHNPMYSFVLREDILFAFGHHVERLINPVYGNWWIWQHGGEEASSNIELFLFEDMFTDEWWQENITNGSRSNLPVLADWNHDDYGRDDLWDGIRWVGEITENNVETVQTHNGTSFDIHSDMSVLFTAYTDEGETIERTGTLSVVLTPNYEDDSVINYRLLIAEADLVMHDN